MFARNRSEGVQVLSSMNAKQKRYEALVKAFHADIYRYAYWLVKDRSVAEDVVQETFLRAWRSLDALNDEKAAKSWLRCKCSSFTAAYYFINGLTLKHSGKVVRGSEALRVDFPLLFFWHLQLLERRPCRPIAYCFYQIAH